MARVLPTLISTALAIAGMRFIGLVRLWTTIYGTGLRGPSVDQISA
jgi:hypothetical protein